MEHAQWKNINTVCLETSNTRELVCIVCNMAQIKDITVGEFQYRGLYDDLMPCLLSNKSKLGELSIRKFLYEWDIEDA